MKKKTDLQVFLEGVRRFTPKRKLKPKRGKWTARKVAMRKK